MTSSHNIRVHYDRIDDGFVKDTRPHSAQSQAQDFSPLSSPRNECDIPKPTKVFYLDPENNILYYGPMDANPSTSHHSAYTEYGSNQHYSMRNRFINGGECDLTSPLRVISDLTTTACRRAEGSKQEDMILGPAHFSWEDSDDEDYMNPDEETLKKNEHMNRGLPTLFGPSTSSTSYKHFCNHATQSSWYGRNSRHALLAKAGFPPNFEKMYKEILDALFPPPPDTAVKAEPEKPRAPEKLFISDPFLQQKAMEWEDWDQLFVFARSYEENEKLCKRLMREQELPKVDDPSTADTEAIHIIDSDSKEVELPKSAEKEKMAEKFEDIDVDLTIGGRMYDKIEDTDKGFDVAPSVLSEVERIPSSEMPHAERDSPLGQFAHMLSKSSKSKASKTCSFFRKKISKLPDWPWMGKGKKDKTSKEDILKESKVSETKAKETKVKKTKAKDNNDKMQRARNFKLTRRGISGFFRKHFHCINKVDVLMDEDV